MIGVYAFNGRTLFCAPILGTGPYIFCTCTKEQTEK